jgi:S1-C subfamily serine protease
MLALACCAAASAEVYRYRDADGRWFFTDRPRPGQAEAESDPTRADAAQPEISATRDLATRLHQRFQPTSPVEQSSLAVVKVTSAVGTGSGFFVSDDGLILTNRHVVRPPEEWAAKQEEQLERFKAEIDRLERQLSLPRERYADPDAYDRSKRHLREHSLAYRQAKRELEMKGYAVALQTAFEVELKDGSKLAADLVNVGSNHDLALLQLKGYRTPLIQPMRSGQLRQTQPVYAIGSPLGISDTITAGTYTGSRDGLLVTDARIMPGNSGGPMVNEAGEAVGINTWKATQEGDPHARGFGLAIPIMEALSEFPELRSSAEAD